MLTNILLSFEEKPQVFSSPCEVSSHWCLNPSRVASFFTFHTIIKCVTQVFTRIIFFLTSSGLDGVPECQQLRVLCSAILHHLVSVFSQSGPSLQCPTSSLSQHALLGSGCLSAQQVIHNLYKNLSSEEKIFYNSACIEHSLFKLFKEMSVSTMFLICHMYVTIYWLFGFVSHQPLHKVRDSGGAQHPAVSRS